MDVLLTCSQHFNDIALNELRRHHPRISFVKSVSPEHVLLNTAGAWQDFTLPWHQHLPIYLHHLFPVQQTLALSGTPADFDMLRRTARRLSQADVLVQARVIGAYPYSATTLELTIAPRQAAGQVPQPTQAVLSVLVVDKTCYMGISTPVENLSPYASGKPDFAETVPNRAGLKLLEAFDSFNIRLRAGNHALDLGAAPGAWTEILRRRGLRVTAVAPNTMYDWLQNDPQIRHFALPAEDYLRQCHTTYDLLLNDMKLDARDSARLMVEYAAHLRSEGIAIMTLKLRLENPMGLIDHALRILRKPYKIIRIRQLVSNRKEVTLFLRRKA